jgi:hypothetical protein
MLHMVMLAAGRRQRANLPAHSIHLSLFIKVLERQSKLKWPALLA